MSIFGPRLRDDVLVSISRPKLKDDVLDSLTIDYFIDSKKNEASFDYHFESELNIKSVTLKSIMFYNSWWTTDIRDGKIFLLSLQKISLEKENAYIPEEGHYSLSDVCATFDEMLEITKISHVKIYCDKNNYIIIELTENKEFSIPDLSGDDAIELDFSFENGWFGFKQTTFDKKGKYYSTKPLNFYRTDLFLRCNLVNQQNTFYNDKHSNILCHFPVDDGDQIRHQIYQPLNCTKLVNRTTNHLRLEITDENSKVINFRGNPVIIHLSFETYA